MIKKKNVIILILIGILCFGCYVGYETLKEATFTSTSISSTTVSPDQTIVVGYTYKNTWGSAYDFKVEGDLDGYTHKDYFRLASGTSYSDDIVFSAPMTEGNYNIDLDGFVELSSGHWTSGDGSANIGITVAIPDVTINSNVADVTITYDGQDYTIDGTQTKTFTNLGDGTHSFIATKDGYNTVNFNVVVSGNDETYSLTMTESTTSLIINSNVGDVGLSYNSETATIDTSKTIEITNLDIGQNYDFTATKSGYVDNTFTINMVDGGVTHELTMVEEGTPTLTLTSNVADVSISYQNGDCTIGESKSIIIEGVPTGQTFEFVATKDGYQTNTFDITINSEDISHSITMIETETETSSSDGSSSDSSTPTVTENIETTIKILNNENPVENAKVFINGETKYTNAQGIVVFSLPVNIHIITVTHDDYSMVSKDYEINSNSNNIIISMTEKDVTDGAVIIESNLDETTNNNSYGLYGGIILMLGIGGYFLYKRK